MNHALGIVATGALLTLGASGQGLPSRDPVLRPTRVFVATSEGLGTDAGEVVEARGAPPWQTRVIGASTGGRHMRHFRRVFYIVNEGQGSIARVHENGVRLPTLHLGPSSSPQDIHVPGAGVAYVTCRDRPELLRFDLRTGTSSVAADLSPFAAPDELLEVRAMHADGQRLFIQLGFVGLLGASRGALAVLDMHSEEFIDADPALPGTQAIELAGAPPRLPMQIRARRLFVSTTLYRLDNRGGIEMVDLDRLVSVGFALTEEQASGVDLGGFVMIDDDAGYFVFHTDIVASTHLHRFTISGGPVPGPDLITLLGDAVDSLAYDPREQRLYLPTGDAGFGTRPGVFVLDTRTDQVLTGTPFDTGLRAHDVLLMR